MTVLFTLFFTLIAGLIVWYSWQYGITPTPTSPKVKQRLLEILPKLSFGEIAELGSGWGTLAFALARRFPACKITAFEISPAPYFCSVLISQWFSYENLKFERRDFFDYPLHEKALVVCYLYPGAMEKLKVKFENELAPEAYVVSHTFAIPGWKPLLVVRASDLYRTPIYLYQIKLSKGT